MTQTTKQAGIEAPTHAVVSTPAPAAQVIGASANDPNAGLAMTLAAIAYCEDIATALSQYAPGWTLAWQPDVAINGNLAYIAYNGSSQYVVAIRGSLLEFSWEAFDNWFKQDLNVFCQISWQYPAGSNGANPMISCGASDGLNDLILLVETTSTSSMTMLEYLMTNAVSAGQSIAVVGHSLGGNLATVYAPWLLYQIKQAQKTPPSLFPVLTFAAPTAGNGDFASAFDASFPNSWRYYNALDIVPMAAASIIDMAVLYPSPAPEASQISVVVDGFTITMAEAVDAIALGIAVAGYDYTQTNQNNGSVALNTNGTLGPMTETDLLLRWFEQASDQHDHNTYLSFLGAKQITCTQSL